MNERVKGLIEEIRRDNTSGAVALTKRGAEMLTLLADVTEARSCSQFLAELIEVGKGLIKAQPTMASLFNLVNAALWEADGREGLEKMRVAVKVSAEGFAAELEERTKMIAEEALALIETGATVMTHSYSSVVLASLLRAKAAEKEFQVICTESRPMREGVALAKRLGQEGIETRLIIDAAAPHFMCQAQVALVGADSVSEQGLVNKIGTYGLALATKAHGMPLYALCGTEKFLPPGYPPQFKIEAKDPREILAEPVENVEAVNYYFDLTPLDCLSGVVTEKGVMAKEAIERLLGQMKVHEGLLCREETR